MAELRPKDVQVAEVGANTLVLRSRTFDRLKFEVEYARQKGTTANAYLIQADQIALIDPPGASFSGLFIEELAHHVYLQRINYVILSHVNPNRLSTLKDLLNPEVAAQITFVCTRAAEVVLRESFPEQALRILVANAEDTIDLGQGHCLHFIPTPTPRHPDALCTYDPATRILYTDKLFGAHVCDDALYDEHWRSLTDDRRYYFDCIHAAQSKQVEAALDRLAEVTQSALILAPGHGPLVRYSASRLVFDYRYWCEQQDQQDFSVALLYASAYGNTATMAAAIARGLTQAGVTVASINCEFADPDEVTAAIAKTDGFIIGSPTLAGHPPSQIQTALGIVLSTAPKTQLAGVFGSFGWSGEAVDLLESKLQDAGYTLGFETLRVKFSPTEEVLQQCEAAGAEFAQILKKTRKTRTLRQPAVDARSDRTEQAVGRVTGSLCVLTAKQGSADIGVLTSWVSQATFNPPGLTIALAKDQAEALLPETGDGFVLNILKEGRNLRRHFQKPMQPGEDRFAAVAHHPASNGCLVLDEAIAFLECQVQNRMECGDHWLIYASVDNGKVLETVGVTAVQHRKSGTYY
ncbi:flavin oxidoreductase [Thermoleptolyngbya sichuanensis A183]|uniref:Flavin oxidoreductase n=1 Tax=Thermoleptolyngbya sichuanensis A183 TaxID=2737172 RepID=A0A6M8B9Q5_9CYAN|nr:MULTISPECIES: diflavin flavoprotein [Thermoleptolyngbya]QKD82872.1 flavin oxidoreductase [Thermoleptolyngbya sichuanensis A183]